MRGPVTSIGPVAEAIRATFGASYADYGILTAIPIAAFGFFSFFSPQIAEKLGLRRAVGAALAVLAAGALLRTAASLMAHWPAMLAATVFVGAGIALLKGALLPADTSLAALEKKSDAARAMARAHAAGADLAALCRRTPGPMGGSYTQKPLLRTGE